MENRIGEEKVIHETVFFESGEATREEIFDYVYDTRKYRKWFNLFPIIWMKFDRPYHEVGCKGRIIFLLPPFTYTLKVVKVVPNEYIELEGSGLLMHGHAIIRLVQKENGILYEQPHWLEGNNKLIDKYYWKLLAPNHDPYMRWRYSILKKMIKKSRLNK